VKRVVITSSFATVVDLSKGPRPGYNYTEQDWNPATYETAASPDTDGVTAYWASKKFAEQAAFEYVERNKPNFTITGICPSMVYGSAAHTINKLTQLNTSSADIYRLINSSENSVPETEIFGYVDMRDVGEAHAPA
jgi:nucleoside-diphosphate-sugar epimerase